MNSQSDLLLEKVLAVAVNGERFFLGVVQISRPVANISTVWHSTIHRKVTGGRRLSK